MSKTVHLYATRSKKCPDGGAALLSALYEDPEPDDIHSFEINKVTCIACLEAELPYTTTVVSDKGLMEFVFYTKDIIAARIKEIKFGKDIKEFLEE